MEKRIKNRLHPISNWKAFLCSICCIFANGSESLSQEVVINYKNVEAVIENTAAALAQEELYYINNDSTRTATSDMLLSSTIRWQMVSMDMAQRKKLQGFDKESQLYLQLVRELKELTKEIARFSEAAVKDPKQMVFCLRSAAAITAAASDLAKTAVIVGMKGNVPDPAKVDPDKLKNKEDNTPELNRDPDTDRTTAEDNNNLLLPDERMNVVNETIERLRKMKWAVRCARYKLNTDFNFRNLLYTASPIDAQLVQNNRIAFETLKNDINSFRFGNR